MTSKNNNALMDAQKVVRKNKKAYLAQTYVKLVYSPKGGSK